MAIPDKAFLDGDVYIDFPFEKVMFHWVKNGQQVFQKFYDDPRERASSYQSDLFRDAQRHGVPTTAAVYDSGKSEKTGINK